MKKVLKLIHLDPILIFLSENDNIYDYRNKRV